MDELIFDVDIINRYNKTLKNSSDEFTTSFSNVSLKSSVEPDIMSGVGKAIKRCVAEINNKSKNLISVCNQYTKSLNEAENALLNGLNTVSNAEISGTLAGLPNLAMGKINFGKVMATKGTKFSNINTTSSNTYSSYNNYNYSQPTRSNTQGNLGSHIVKGSVSENRLAGATTPTYNTKNTTKSNVFSSPNNYSYSPLTGSNNQLYNAKNTTSSNTYSSYNNYDYSSPTRSNNKLSDVLSTSFNFTNITISNAFSGSNNYSYSPLTGSNNQLYNSKNTTSSNIFSGSNNYSYSPLTGSNNSSYYTPTLSASEYIEIIMKETQVFDNNITRLEEEYADLEENISSLKNTLAHVPTSEQQKIKLLIQEKENEKRGLLNVIEFYYQGLEKELGTLGIDKGSYNVIRSNKKISDLEDNLANLNKQLYFENLALLHAPTSEYDKINSNITNIKSQIDALNKKYDDEIIKNNKLYSDNLLAIESKGLDSQIKEVEKLEQNLMLEKESTSDSQRLEEIEAELAEIRGTKGQFEAQKNAIDILTKWNSNTPLDDIEKLIQANYDGVYYGSSESAKINNYAAMKILQDIAKLINENDKSNSKLSTEELAKKYEEMNNSFIYDKFKTEEQIKKEQNDDWERRFLPSLNGAELILYGIGKGFENVGKGAVNAVQGIGQGISDTVTSMKNEISSGYENLIDKIGNTISKANNGEINIFQAAGQIIADYGNTNAATVTQAAKSLAVGFSKGGEGFLDFIATAETGIISLFSAPADAILGQFGDEGSFTNELYKSLDNFVSKERVEDLDKTINNTDFGNWLNENSIVANDSATMNIASGIGEAIFVIAAGSAITKAAGLAEGSPMALDYALNHASTINAAKFASTIGSAEFCKGAVTTLVAGAKGFGRAEEMALNDGADIASAIRYGAASGAWEMAQWAAGQGINKFANTGLANSTSVLKSAGIYATSTAADTVDSAVEGFVQPWLKQLYSDKSYEQLFEENGGWNAVGQQAIMGGVMSLAGTAKEFGQSIKGIHNSHISDVNLDNVTNNLKNITDNVLDKLNIKSPAVENIGRNKMSIGQNVKNLLKTEGGAIMSIGALTAAIECPALIPVAIPLMLKGINIAESNILGGIKDSNFGIMKKQVGAVDATVSGGKTFAKGILSDNKIETYRISQQVSDLSNFISGRFDDVQTRAFGLPLVNLIEQLKTYDIKGNKITYSCESQSQTLMFLRKLAKEGYIENLKYADSKLSSQNLEKFIMGAEVTGKQHQLYEIQFELSPNKVFDADAAKKFAKTLGYDPESKLYNSKEKIVDGKKIVVYEPNITFMIENATNTKLGPIISKVQSIVDGVKTKFNGDTTNVKSGDINAIKEDSMLNNDAKSETSNLKSAAISNKLSDSVDQVKQTELRDTGISSDKILDSVEQAKQTELKGIDIANKSPDEVFEIIINKYKDTIDKYKNGEIVASEPKNVDAIFSEYKMSEQSKVIVDELETKCLNGDKDAIKVLKNGIAYLLDNDPEYGKAVVDAIEKLYHQKNIIFDISDRNYVNINDTRINSFVDFAKDDINNINAITNNIKKLLDRGALKINDDTLPDSVKTLQYKAGREITSNEYISNFIKNRQELNEKIYNYLCENNGELFNKNIESIKTERDNFVNDFIKQEKNDTPNDFWKQKTDELLNSNSSLKQIFEKSNIEANTWDAYQFAKEFCEKYGTNEIINARAKKNIIDDFYKNHPNIINQIKTCDELIAILCGDYNLKQNPQLANALILDGNIGDYNLSNVVDVIDGLYNELNQLKMNNNTAAIEQFKIMFGEECYNLIDTWNNGNLASLKEYANEKVVIKPSDFSKKQNLFKTADEIFELGKKFHEQRLEQSDYLSSLSPKELEEYVKNQVKPENKPYIDKLEEVFKDNSDPLALNLVKNTINYLLETNSEYGKMFVEGLIKKQQETGVHFTFDDNGGSYYDPVNHVINFDSMIIDNNDIGTSIHEMSHLFDGEYNNNRIPDMDNNVVHNSKSGLDKKTLTDILNARDKGEELFWNYLKEEYNFDDNSIRNYIISQKDKNVNDFIEQAYERYKNDTNSTPIKTANIPDDIKLKMDEILDSDPNLKELFEKNNIRKDMDTYTFLLTLTDEGIEKAINSFKSDAILGEYDIFERNNIVTYDEFFTGLYYGKENATDAYKVTVYGHSNDYYSYGSNYQLYKEGLAEFSRMTLTGDIQGLKQLKAIVGDEYYNYYETYFNQVFDKVREEVNMESGATISKVTDTTEQLKQTNTLNGKLADKVEQTKSDIPDVQQINTKGKTTPLDELQNKANSIRERITDGISIKNTIENVDGVKKANVFSTITDYIKKQKDIKKLLNEGRYEDIFVKYGESEYNNHLKEMYANDVLNETGSKLKSEVSKFKFDLKRDMIVNSIIGVTGAFLVSELLIPLFVGDSAKKEEEKKYAELIEKYNQKIEEYAKEVNELGLTDLQIMMKVMDDMWNSIEGYGWSDTINGSFNFGRLAFAEDNGAGVCQNMADDVAAKLNAINPKYNARTVVVSMSNNGGEIINSPLANIEQKIVENVVETSSESNSGEQQTYVMDNLQNIVGNHMVTFVDIPDENLTLILDPTNPSIGVFRNGKIYTFSNYANEDFKFDYTIPTLSQRFKGTDAHFDFYNTRLKSYFDNKESLDSLNQKYGIAAENAALEYVRNINNNGKQ